MGSPYTPSSREAIILHHVADPYTHGHRDRVPVDISAINNRSLIDTYFLTLDSLRLQSLPQNPQPQPQTFTQLHEHEKRLPFFRAYYLLANGYYTEQELKEHPGVVEVVEGLRARGKLGEGEDIEYAGFEGGGGGRRRGVSSVSRKRKGGLRGRLNSILSRDA